MRVVLRIAVVAATTAVLLFLPGLQNGAAAQAVGKPAGTTAPKPAQTPGPPRPAALFRVSENFRSGYIDKTGKAILWGFEDAGSFSEGLAPVKLGNWVGFIDATGKVVIAAQYADAGSFSGGLARVRVGTSWGYVDRAGMLAIPLQFGAAEDFSEGYAAVKIGGTFGTIDPKGTVVVQPRYDGLSILSDGLMAFRQGGKWGFLDKTGAVVIGPQFDRAGDFSGGLAPAWQGAKCGFIDKSGQWVVEPKYDDAMNFSEGLAPVMSIKRDVVRDEETGRVVKMQVFHRWGQIDPTGKEVIAVDLDKTGPFSEGVAPAWRNEQFGYMDKSGKLALQPIYSKNPGAFHNGLARVEMGWRLGYIDAVGTMVVPQQFSDLGSFGDGLAPARIHPDSPRDYLNGSEGRGLWGYIDATGQFAIKPRFEDALVFRHGLAAVQVDGKWGLVGKDGKTVLKPQYKAVAVQSEKIAAVEVGGVWGFVDTAGQSITEPQFEAASFLGTGQAVVKKGGKCGVVDGAGKVVVPPQYDDCGWLFSEGLLGVTRNGKAGFIAPDGSIAIAPQYEAAAGFTQGDLSAVKMGGKWGFVDRAGNMVVAPTYDMAVGFSEERAAVRAGGLWGFIDRTGKAAIAPRFQQAEYFSDGLAAVKVDDKWGYVDKTGRLAIAPQFDVAEPFEHGLARVHSGTQVAYVNPAGTTVWTTKPDPMAKYYDSHAGDSGVKSDAAGAGVRTLKVEVAVDQIVSQRPDWRKAIEKRVQVASDLYEKNFGIRFAVTRIVPWESPSLGEDANPDDYISSVLDRLQDTVPPLDAELVLGFTGQDRHGVGHAGVASAFGRHVLVNDSFSGPGGIEIQAAYTVVHEISHAFGMFHVKDEQSFLHYSMSFNPQAGMEQWHFDPYTVRHMNLMRGFDFTKGVDSLSAQQVREAQAIFTEGTDLDSDVLGRKVAFLVGWGYGAQGAYLARMGERVLATREFAKAAAVLAKDPDPQIYLYLGQNLLGVRFGLDGFETIRKSIALKSNFAQGHFTLGAALDWQEREDIRFVQLQQSDAPAPSLADILRRYVLLHPDSAETLREYQQAAKLGPENAYYHARLGAALAVRHRDSEALAEYARAAELQPTSASYKAKLESLKQRIAAAGAAK